MPVNQKKFIIAGIQEAWIGRSDTSGYVKGISGTVASGGNSAMRVLDGVQSWNMNIASGPTESVLGDNGVIGEFRFFSQEPNTASMNVGVIDLETLTEMVNANLYTDGDLTWSGITPELLELKDMWLVLNAPAKSREVGSIGIAGWHVQIYKAVIQRQKQETATASAGGDTYDMTVQRFDKTPWGETITTTNFGATILGGLETWAENPITLHTLVGDAATNTVVLSKQASADNGSKVRVFKNGTALTYNASPSTNAQYSVVTTAGVTTVTIGSMGSHVASGDVIVVRYEYLV